MRATILVARNNNTKEYTFEVYNKEQNITVRLVVLGSGLSKAEKDLGELIGKEDVIIGVVNDSRESSGS